MAAFHFRWGKGGSLRLSEIGWKYLELAGKGKNQKEKKLTDSACCLLPHKEDSSKSVINFCLKRLREFGLRYISLGHSREGQGSSRNPDISEVEAAAGTISLPQPPLGICPSLMSESQEGYPSSQEEAPSTSSQALLGAEFLPRNAIDDKVGELVEFLFLKYRNKELTTRAEILRTVLTDCQELFPVILSQACECMQLIFGIDVQEVDLQVHSYVLTNTLGLTYNDTLSSEQKLPNGGLLIFILTKIFIEGNRAPEEGIWESLSMMGVHPGKEHFIFGEPRKLLTKVWVQEQYLEYLQVPGSHPACYEFLWGPRAYAETSKMEVLEFFARISDSNPRSFEVWYEEALREQEERAHARLSTTDDTPAMACTDTNAMTSAGFSV
ncbi:melanoma-associated antigen 10-like [Sorex fumeus]|uniref:melanoma-associated antigen 10-like n=1 Tax=Sorex fumeus TaxID=62283 RepID=UPI0024AD5ABD|nr:melanoma-associated antigen 10-like [Sorex fumeus]